MRNVWAIGDLVGEPMLAHKAMAQGAMVAEIIAGQRRRFDPAGVAAIVFTDPEIVVAGMLPDEAAAAGIDAETSVFPFAANGRALTLEAGEGGGFVRVVSTATTGAFSAFRRSAAKSPSWPASSRTRWRWGGARRSGAHDPCPPDPGRGGRRGRCSARPRAAPVERGKRKV